MTKSIRPLKQLVLDHMDEIMVHSAAHVMRGGADLRVGQKLRLEIAREAGRKSRFVRSVTAMHLSAARQLISSHI